MWTHVGGWAMTDEVVAQVREAAPNALPIYVGECSCWIAFETGARMLHVRFGGYFDEGSSHSVYYRSPNGELVDVSDPVSGLNHYERVFLSVDTVNRKQALDINTYRWREVNHAVERALGLRDDDFADEWPGTQ